MKKETFAFGLSPIKAVLFSSVFAALGWAITSKIDALWFDILAGGVFAVFAGFFPIVYILSQIAKSKIVLDEKSITIPASFVGVGSPAKVKFRDIESILVSRGLFNTQMTIFVKPGKLGQRGLGFTIGQISVLKAMLADSKVFDHIAETIGARSGNLIAEDKRFFSN